MWRDIKQAAEDQTLAARFHSDRAEKDPSLENHSRAKQEHLKASNMWENLSKIDSGAPAHERNNAYLASEDHREEYLNHHNEIENFSPREYKLNRDYHSKTRKKNMNESLSISKRFDLLVEENYGNPTVAPVTGGYVAIDDVDTNVTDFSKQFVDKLNFYLSDLSNKPFINPYSALNQLKWKFNMIGLEFQRPVLNGNHGEVDIPLLKHGGTYGADIHTGKIGFDNGWGDDAGFHMHLNYLNNLGKWTLSARIEKDGYSDSGHDEDF